MFFDIFTTDGFIGDLLCVNMQYAPFMEVLPRKYRFRILNACMSRFIKLALSWNWTAVPFQFIANDGNLVVNPIDLLELDEQGIAERYDIVVDFSKFRIGDRIYLVNLLKQTRRPQAGRGAEPARGHGRDPDKRSHRRAAHGVPHRQLGQQRRRAGLRAQVHHARQERGAGRAHPADPDRAAGAHARGRVRPLGRRATRAARDGQCTPDCPEMATELSRGPSKSTARMRIPSTPTASRS